MKSCQVCGTPKPLSDYSPKRDSRDGHSHQCKACANKRAKAWNALNKERVCARSDAWRKANRERFNAHLRIANGRYRAAKNSGVPPWYDDTRVREVYDLAEEFRGAGFKVDVDHIVPLQGKTVSGLHWHGNLRVCLASVNRAKRNAASEHHGPLASRAELKVHEIA